MGAAWLVVGVLILLLARLGCPVFGPTAPCGSAELTLLFLFGGSLGASRRYLGTLKKHAAARREELPLGLPNVVSVWMRSC